MKRRERILLVLSIWLCVFPGVLLFSYGIRWAGVGWPMWLEIMVSTALTVPLINLAVVPAVERLIAAARHESGRSSSSTRHAARTDPIRRLCSSADGKALRRIEARRGTG